MVNEFQTYRRGLNYPKGAAFFISFYEDQYLKQIIETILKDPEMCHGMRVVNITVEEEPDFSKRTFFRTASPIFIRRYDDEKNNKHYTYEDEEAGELMKETLFHKMRLVGLPVDETLRIRFDTSVPNKKVKLIDYRGIKNRVSQLCPVIIEGKPETKAFAWNVGLGSSTGIGFGAIY